ncbi:MAG: alpha/beta hydrolase [Rhodopseudomonas palustris]|nr:alpha/beta hydrolase [Rhodopseudomonas palustris]
MSSISTPRCCCSTGPAIRAHRYAAIAGREVSHASGADLAATLELVLREVRPSRLWLMANSMGGQVVVDAFRRLYQDAEFSDAATEIENVVLTAADVDHADFNERRKDEIKALAGNVTVYVSSSDRALLVSRFINRGLRLGESTLDPAGPESGRASGEPVRDHRAGG